MKQSPQKMKYSWNRRKGEIFMNIPIFSQEKGSNGRSKGLEWQRGDGDREKGQRLASNLVPITERGEGKMGLKSNTQTWVRVNECRSQIEDERSDWDCVGSWRENVLLQDLNRRFYNMQPALGPATYKSWGCPWTSRIAGTPCRLLLPFVSHKETWAWSRHKIVHLKSQ